jgi:hypothetical protein
MPTKINPGVTVGIYLAATIRETDSQYRTIRFESPLRLEHIFIIIVFLLIAITASFRHQPPVAVIGFFAAWLFCHLWFHFLYRFQERSLLRKVVNNLSLAGD